MGGRGAGGGGGGDEAVRQDEPEEEVLTGKVGNLFNLEHFVCYLTGENCYFGLGITLP